MRGPLSHKEIRGEVLQAHVAEYRDLFESWKLVETKAQGAVAIAGIFLAAAFSFAKDLSADTPMVARVPLAVSILLLLGAVLAAVVALVVSEAPRAPAGDTIAQLAAPVLRTAEPGMDAQVTNFLNDQAEVWQETNSRLNSQLASKALHVRKSQWSLFAAAAAFMVHTVIVIFTR